MNLKIYCKDEFKSLQKSSVPIKVIYQNLVDLIWENRPPAPNGTIFELGIEFSGQSTSDKLSNIRTSMKSKNVNCYIVTALDEIAWILNLRGSDIEYNTVFFSYLIITMEEVRFYVDKSKFKSSDIEKHLESSGISVRLYTSYIQDLTQLTQQSSSVFIDPTYCNYATYSSIKSETIQEGTSFIRFEKAIKNDVERQGFRNCHVRDGLAVVRYLAWLGNELKLGHVVNEFDGALKLESFRAEGSHFLRSSFETISAYGENAAIIHYSPTRENHANIGNDNVYLLDSGGQYLDGTTDITRTVHFGEPSEKVKRSFTRVLQGQLALSSLIFPSGLAGDKMEPIARFALWKEGLNYNHGSGHGVGHCLDVHEGPHGIGVPGFGFKEHYDVTIEPGYYEIGNFGIRIENLYLVRKSQTPNNFDGKTYLEFEQITYCPIQPTLVDTELLSDKELHAVNEYNQQVWEKLSPLLSNDLLALQYLKRNTQPIDLINSSNSIVTILAISLVTVLVICAFSIIGNVYFAIKIRKESKRNGSHHHNDGELQALSEDGY